MTSRAEKIVADLSHGPGERIERSRQRRRSLIVGILFVVGMITGAYGAHTVLSQGMDLSRPWSPTISLSLAALYLIAMIAGSIAMAKVVDEVEIQNSYKTGSFAGVVYLIVYPVWFLLWKGGFVAEPVHWMLFILFWVALAGSSLYYKYR